MEPPGVLPPDRDRDKYFTTTQPNVNTSTATNQLTSSTSIGGVSTSASTTGQLQSSTTSSAQQQQPIERLSRPMAFDKMECLVKEMQDTETGVPVRSQKLFLTSIPSAFMGYDLIEWLMERLSIEESEALSISNQLCLHGYFFPVNDSKMLVVKDDSSLYRFQTPYYWPWQHKAPDNVEYAIYLAKRSLRNKQRHGLEDYETEALANLHKNLKGKWDFITMQAEEQVKLAKERKKGDKIVGDSQERAYWRVHRPPPGQFTPLEPCPVPSRDRQGKPRGRKVEDWQREVDFLTTSLGRTRMKMSQACECLVTYCETFSDYDPMLQQPIPNNPWVSDDPTFWQLNSTIVDVPTEKRVRRWAISIEEIVSDPTGRLEFTAYLKKEYSHENIRFWLAVNDLRRSAHSMIPHKVKEIYEEFLAPGAPCEINIDGKTMENVQQGLKNPSRFAFDSAAEHIYALLLKKDCYPRFIRSDHYKALLATGIQKSHKKGFFRFPGKKKSTTTAPNPASLTQTSGSGSTSAQGNLTRRRGSDRSLSGSAHELAVSGVKDGTKVPHSHSQSNLSDIPYRGDMPTGALPIHMENPIVPSSTSGGSNDASYHNIQEASRSFNEPLETTLEVSGGGACSVCPWETIDESVATSKQVAHNVSVSVCPWEEETLPTTSNTKSNVLHTTSSDSKLIKINLEHADDLSEKMKRSCGLRQNTLDDYQSNKRLATVVEQRRASVTVAPKLSDFQFNQRRPRNIDLKSTHQPDATLLPSFGTPKQPVVSQSSLPLARAVSFEGRDVEICTTSSPAHQSIIITEETPPSTSAVASSSSNMGAIPKSIRCNNQNKSNANNINLINKSNESLTKSQNNQNLENESEEKQKTPKLSSSSVNVNVVETKCELNNDEKQTINEKIKSRSSSEAIDEETTVDLDDDRDDVKVLSSSKNNSSANLVMHIAGTDPDLSKLTCSTPTPSRNTPPIIHVVTCPTIQIDSKEAPDDEDDELPFTSTSVEPNESDHPRVVFTQESIESEIQVTIDPPPPSQKDDDSDLNVKNQVDEDKDSGQLGKKLDVESKIKFIIDDEESGMHEDLSPTAEEYQECMAFQQSSESDYYDIATGGGNLAPGCVAPAPTPAPSIAPLAEVEIDPADDEIDAESKDSGDAKLDENSKKKRKKKLHEKTDSQEKATTSTDEATKSSSNEQQNRFAVCPWEDEDVTSTVDQPFVKTYSTLGYL